MHKTPYDNVCGLIKEYQKSIFAASVPAESKVQTTQLIDKFSSNNGPVCLGSFLAAGITSSLVINNKEYRNLGTIVLAKFPHYEIMRNLLHDVYRKILIRTKCKPVKPVGFHRANQFNIYDMHIIYDFKVGTSENILKQDNESTQCKKFDLCDRVIIGYKKPQLPFDILL